VSVVTAKERLRKLVEGLSETEAEEALRVIDRPEAAERDPVIEMLDNAPPEDEEISAEEEAAVEEAQREYERGGKLYTAEEIKHELL
jgi:hypothetical protein